MNVFLAGATGTIGKRLVPLLIHAGYEVAATTRSPDKSASLCKAGAEPVVVDVFDAPALARALAAAKPTILVDQLTDLPHGLDPDQIAEGTRRNARMRKEGTSNLVSAALRAGVHCIIEQSIAWMYAPGLKPHTENDPLDMHAKGVRAITVEGVTVLEGLILSSLSIRGTVLRYGHLYGPGTGARTAPDAPALHVGAAGQAALLAIEKHHGGVFNIAEQNGYLSNAKARRELGFDPDFRLGGAKSIA